MEMMLVLHDEAKREYAYDPATGLPDTHVGTSPNHFKNAWAVVSIKTIGSASSRLSTEAASDGEKTMIRSFTKQANVGGVIFSAGVHGCAIRNRWPTTCTHGIDQPDIRGRVRLFQRTACNN
ncbi:hypothetical protein [Edaphobacter modestus]|uniref:hypothetical protein n=1 Tax=Edaphobacter modestus TaxID=388466 RepID=UPI001A936926|nr:hypothetical protein [Edaphobacter modestus]